MCAAQVNGNDVVKVGHRQVVALIRQGGSRLLMKVVSVSRKSESNLIRKKGATFTVHCTSLFYSSELPSNDLFLIYNNHNNNNDLDLLLKYVMLC